MFSCSDIVVANRGTDLTDACSNVIIADRHTLSVATGEDAEELEAPLLGGDSYVQFLQGQSTVSAEFCSAPSGSKRSGEPAVARTTLPLEIGADLPMDWIPGRSVRVRGPHGPMTVKPPPDAQPGRTMRYRLAPEPEFRIQVPPGAAPGHQVKFARDDGVGVSVPVPHGCKPGDTFDVSPPSLMVQVPEGASPGDAVVFRNESSKDTPTSWMRCQVPPGLAPRDYFPARLPAPEDFAAAARAYGEDRSREGHFSPARAKESSLLAEVFGI